MFFKKHFLNSKERKELSQRVDLFESKTGCEIVFHIRKKLEADALVHSEKLFHKFGLHKTQHRATVFIVISTEDRKYCVWVDRNVKIKTDDNLWHQAGEILKNKLSQEQRLVAFMQLIDFIQPQLEKVQPEKFKKMEKSLSNNPIEE